MIDRKNLKDCSLKWTFYYCGLFVQREWNHRLVILAFLYIITTHSFYYGGKVQCQEHGGDTRTCPQAGPLWRQRCSEQAGPQTHSQRIIDQMLGQWARVGHDNCVSTSWMRKQLMRLTGWPECSPELNPIKHLWDIMYRCTDCHYGAPQTVEELTDALIKRSHETIGHVTWSTFRCCSECIQASGGHTFTGRSPFILFNSALNTLDIYVNRPHWPPWT